MILSAVICTHNPRRDYLDRTLAALKAQTLTQEQWELILIDNRSDVALRDVLDLRWHPQSRMVREEDLGILPARVRGLKEAKAELILFVDDDNVLAPDYLEQAIAIGATHSFLGVWGGAIAPEFETPPPDWIGPFRHLLACVEVEEDRWSNLKFSYATIPPTAGMCLRRVVAETFVEVVRNDPRRKLLGRRGKQQLTNGEDTDLALTACDIGLGMGQFKRLRLTHLIPASRLRGDYLLSLAEGTAFCAHILGALRGHPPQVPHSAPVRKLLGNLRRMTWSSRRRRHFEGQLRALNTACRLVAEWP
jgi:glycosyltransferase involved in cell wall biosynthesis